MKGIWIIAVLLLVSLGVEASDNQLLKAKMEMGNDAYSKEKYDSALTFYETVANSNYHSVALYFNLGNTYYRLNRIPQAILYYEKALKMEPNNEDIQHNLKLAQLKTVDKIEAIPDLFLNRWWRDTVNLMSADHWAQLSILCLFIMLLGLAAYFFVPTLLLRKLGFFIGFIALTLGLASWLLGGQQHHYANHSSHAIIYTPTVTIYGSPTEGSTKLFVLHQGTKVRMDEQVSGWTKVRIPNGNEGWISSKHLEEI